jgi:heme/copper-type cytochrome/quinol oxidase subunit 2
MGASFLKKVEPRVRGLAFVGAPVTILLLLSMLSSEKDCSRGASDETSANFEGKQSVVEIEVTGEKFFWSFRYPGKDGVCGTSDDFVLPQKLIVPLNRQVRLQLKSLDYIYVFEIPPLGIREIAVPDLEYSVEFSIKEPMASSLPMDSLCAFGLFQNDSMGTISGDDQAWERLASH